MEAIIDIGLMPDLSNVDGVAQNIMKTAAAVAAVRLKLIDFPLEFAQTPQLLIKIKDALDIWRVLGVRFQRLNFGV
jgi:hypothetical protein